MNEFKKYTWHRGNAKKRNIPFLLTFEEWWDIWQKSGHWEERGTKKGQYCMSRYNDTGPYAVGNVFIQLHSQNSSDGNQDITRQFFRDMTKNPAKDPVLLIKRADSRAEDWEFTDPQGNKHIIHNASQFCKKNNLSLSALSAVASGLRNHHKGWTCKKL